MKRTLWVLVAMLVLAAAVAGCSPDSPDTTGSQDSGETAAGSGDTAGSDSEPAEPAGPATLTPETDGEKEALTLAQSEEARKWGSGDWQNGTPVAGEPFLVGYGVLVHDGATQYQVTVADGEVIGFFGKNAPSRYVEAPFANYNPTIEPESARQTEAFEAAKTEISGVNPNATQGGIEYYLILYPSQLEGTYPSVSIYASPTVSASPWAMGGSFGW